MAWAAALGTIGGAAVDAVAQHSANSANVNLNRKNRDWQEEMSNSAWQRGVADMKTAGINPMLAVSQGPASTPSNSAATVHPIQVGQQLGSATAAALAAQQQQANIQLTKAQTWKEQALGDLAQFNVNPEIINDRYKNEMDAAHAAIRESVKRGDFTEAQAKQVTEMLPLLMATERSRAALNIQQTSSAHTTENLAKLDQPEKEATADWFRTMGASGKMTDLIKNILMIIGRSAK